MQRGIESKNEIVSEWQDNVKWILQKFHGRAWPDEIWLRTEKSARNLWSIQRNL